MGFKKFSPAKTIIWIFFLSFLAIASTKASTPKKKLSLEKKVKIFCGELDPNNKYCEEYRLATQRWLELKGELLLELENHCQRNYQKDLCQTKDIQAITLYCNKIGSISYKCEEWKNWRLRRLETMGKLLEEIQAFCQKKHSHKICF